MPNLETDRFGPEARFALYFAPPKVHPLAKFGSAVLGRDAIDNCAVPHPELAGFNTRLLFELTAAPRRYGFHGTLKPPFHLAEGTSVIDLVQRLKSFCRTREAFSLTALAVSELGQFIALAPQSACAELTELAAALVSNFDDFRAPADNSELEKRRQAGLTPRQEVYLQQWGYPYVMDAFRFHMTLSDKIADASLRGRLRQALADAAAPALQPALVVDGVRIFVQADRASNFHQYTHLAFGVHAQ